MDLLPQLGASLADRYAIEREIGRGGMATVYLARDIRHSRHVALKVLNPELGAVLGVERFLSEIRVTANLQHSNLLPLFDSGETDGLLFYVMPYVEGESLRQRIDREKQLPIDEAVRISAAIASALDYAHRRGVIHRDLKPENVLMHEGQPLVSDFGIALAVSNAGGQRVTQTGLSLGTPQYMSPEQATGDRSVDARTDIYSLGAVTYELLTGEPPHSGTNAQAVIAKLMTEEPRPMTVLRRSVPVHVDAAVRRALEKLPADRFATAKEFADALTGKTPIDVRHASVPVPVVSRSARAAVFASLGIAGISLALAAVAWWKLSRTSATTEPVRFALTLPPDQRFDDPPGESVAVSPDGKTIAYLVRGGGRRVIVVRRLSELVGRELRGTDGASDIHFSPDGKWIAYSLLGVGLMKVAVDGGTPVLLSTAGNTTGKTWGVQRLVYTQSRRVYSLSPDGGTPRTIAAFTGPDSAGWLITDPVGLANENLVIFDAANRDKQFLGVVSADSGAVTLVDLPVANALAYVDGWLLFGRRDGTMAAARVDLRSGKVTGETVQLANGFRAKLEGGVASSVSHGEGGTFAYLDEASPTTRPGEAQGRMLSVVDDHGVRTFVATERREYAYPTWSPDGKRIALDVTAAGGSTPDIWILDVTTNVLSRLTTTGGTRPTWSADGKHVAYLAVAGATSDIYWTAADGSGGTERLATGQRYREIEFSPDGRFMLARTDANAATRRDLWVIDLRGDRTAKPFLVTPSNELMPVISADGKWVAYQSDETGRMEIYVRPFGREGGRVQISSGGGIEPRWMHGKNRLVYRNDGFFRSATLSLTDTSVTVSARDSLFADVYAATFTARHGYDITSDGKRFVVLGDGAEKSSVIVVTNWLDEVRRTLAGRR